MADFHVGQHVVLAADLRLDGDVLSVKAGAVGIVEDIFEDGMLQVCFPDDEVHWVEAHEVRDGENLT